MGSSKALVSLVQRTKSNATIKDKQKISSKAKKARKSQ